MGKKDLHPVHPGEVLLEEFLKPMGLSQNRLALDIGVPPRRINEIVLGKRSITADTALRLARYFGNSPQFWLGLQRDYDLDVAAETLGERLETRGAGVCYGEGEAVFPMVHPTAELLASSRIACADDAYFWSPNEIMRVE